MTQPADPRPASSALTLGERVAEQLRRKITQGEFGPGQRLSEQALSDDLAISRNTLREVFRVLTKDGLLKHVPNRGVFVAVPSIASIIDIYRVRRLIECQALAQAYPRHPAKKRMRDAFEEALRCRAVEDWPGVGTANMAFHMAVVELADSERLNLLFAHGSDAGLDRALYLQRVSPGEYRAACAPIPAGRWRVALEDSAGQWGIREELDGSVDALTLRPRSPEGP